MGRNELLSEYFDISSSLQRAWKRHMSSVLADDNISMAQLGVLMMIKEQDKVLSKDIALRLGVTRSAVAQIIDGLNEQELITRDEDVSDRRRVFLGLSKKGLSLLSQMEESRRALLTRLVSDLDDNHLESMLTAQRAMLAKLQQELPQCSE